MAEVIGWTPVHAQDPSALTPLVDRVVDTQGEVWAMLAPLRPPVVEKKGLLGRTKRTVAPWSATIQGWGRAGSHGELTVWLQFPEGRRLAEHGLVPEAGGVVENDGSGDAILRWPPGTPSGVVAAEALRFVRTLFGEQVGDAWQARVDDTFYDLSGDATLHGM